MSIIYLKTRNGCIFPIDISKNCVINSGHTNKITIEAKFNGKEYLIQTCDIKENRPRGRPNRYLADATNTFNADENAPPPTANSEEQLANLKRKLTEPLLPNPFNSNLSLHQLSVAPPLPPKFPRMDAFYANFYCSKVSGKSDSWLFHEAIFVDEPRNALALSQIH